MTLKWKIPCSWTYPSPPQPPCLTDPHVIHPLEGRHWCYWWSARKILSLKEKKKEILRNIIFPLRSHLVKLGIWPLAFWQIYGMSQTSGATLQSTRRRRGEPKSGNSILREGEWLAWLVRVLLVGDWSLIISFFKPVLKLNMYPICMNARGSVLVMLIFNCTRVIVRSFAFLDHFPQYLHANICR